MLSRRSVFFFTITSFVVGISSNVDASKHSQIVRPEFQRRVQTLDEDHQRRAETLDEDHDEHGDEDHDEHGDEDHDEHGDKDKPWGEVIVASLLINLASLIGVFFLVGSFASKKYLKPGMAGENDRHNWKFAHNIIPSFACGALLATSLFLILPESFNLISEYQKGQGGEDEHEDEDEHDAHRMLEEDDHEDHVDTDVPVAWRFGVSVIGGFLLPVVTAMIFPHEHDPEPELCCEPEVAAAKVVEESDVVADAKVADDSHDEKSELESQVPVAVEKTEEPTLERVTPINYSLASSVLLGDFFHNFTDGIFIGTAFMLCDRDLAITISAATIYHELAQELADYFLLTKHCNIRPFVALTLNFVSGLSVLFGALLILSMDVNSNTTGCLLAIGAGVYLYIAASECLPRARAAQKNKQDKLVSLVSFVCGVVPIGLVLLNHGHCEASH